MEKNKFNNDKKFVFIEKFNNLTEENVGIVEYINKEAEGFEGILKHRYSDFIVNEISENGQVVWLKQNPNGIFFLILR